MIEDQFGRQRGRPRAKAAVSLLERDDIGIQLAQDIDDAVGTAQAVKPDPLVNIVAGNFEHHRVA